MGGGTGGGTKLFNCIMPAPFCGNRALSNLTRYFSSDFSPALSVVDDRSDLGEGDAPGSPVSRHGESCLDIYRSMGKGPKSTRKL